MQATPFTFLELAPGAVPHGSACEGTWRLAGLDNRVVELNVEVWNNSYNLLVLLWKPTKRVLLRHRRILLN